MRVRLLIAVATLPLVLWGVLPLFSGAQTASVSSLQKKITVKRDAIAGKKAHERELASRIHTVSVKINSLQADITTLQTRQTRIQADLDRKRARLARIQSELRYEQARLVRLRARLAQARVVLARRLVELYKADSPDILTVILNSDGFADLLERSEFARRVGQQDRRIITNVIDAKQDADATAKRLDGLERDASRVAREVQARRDEVARVKGTLVDRRNEYAVIRHRRSTVLASVVSSRHELEGDLHVLEREQARITSTLQRSAVSNGVNPNIAGPIRAGGGGLIWPVNGTIVSPFGMRWGRLHAGVDIAVPSGTPIRAAAAGTVVLMGWVSGYGNYTCVQHGGALSTCYAHQASFATSQGAPVSQGQVIGYSDCTGHCFGPHLHFETRINGSPVDPMGYL